ncbi:hypothetical protein B5M09_010257 [Aphanomyces astaci]|uniref:Uncharacterized protein n=1 Tax=Aphanomyces astaci TaxID=112090 RepID=A0A397EE49_APHAT|nr:hypothetical protein DYB38_000421 [Aphanomyces astaci]RHZ30829.1 hypothetical protein DYB26_012928 [Aphanomyces astaci]RQM20806.1 hypothetical protein B5M09_010257 [Aphanomyces astaci]
MATSLRDLVTVIVTTSAIPSNPSTSVLEDVLTSFSFVPGLNSCDTILTCDGYVLKSTEGESKFKSMRINEDELANYLEYQERARIVFRRHLGYEDAEAGSLHSSTSSTSTIRIGARLRAETTVVSNHPIDLASLCHTMNAHRNILHYIGFSSRKSLRRTQRPHPCLPPAPAQTFGPHVLSPLFFWYDKPHVGRTSQYRSFVYGHGRFQTGDFIEDTMGHAMLADLKHRGMSGHADYGTWTYVNQHMTHEPTLRHRSGRHFRETVFLRSSKKKGKQDVPRGMATGDSGHDGARCPLESGSSDDSADDE